MREERHELSFSEKQELDAWLIEQDRQKVKQRIAQEALRDIKENKDGGLIDLEEIGGGFENIDNKIDSLTESSQELSNLQQEMVNISNRSVVEALRTKRDLDNETLGWELALKLERQNILENNPTIISTRNTITDAISDKLNNLHLKTEELEKTSPESWNAIKGLELRQNVKEIHDRKLIKTPYVEKNLNRLKKDMERGQPSFIHGHLGSGKTELAVTAAKETVVESIAFEETKNQYQTWLSDNPNSKAAERRRYLAKAYKSNLDFINSRLRNGDKELTEKCSPLIISGSKDLTSQDLYSEKTLKLSKFNGKTILEHKLDLDREITQWEEDNQTHLSQLTTEQQAQERADAANKILEIYKLKNQAFGTEVETIQKEIYRGVIEGRPVIIDEINAIPSAVLISMNDILQRRPGQTCSIPGVGPVKIKPGFSITMTGNLSSNRISYEGTNDLNPAFLSRLDIFEHDYLPQSCEDRGYEQQTDPKKNELFRIMLTHLVNDKGHLQLPEMDKSLTKLFRLAQLARTTQDIFSDKWVESRVNTDAYGDEAEPRLEKAVLSIRNILNVLVEWNKGSEKDLDMALWEGFVSNITNPDDQNLILGLAQQYNFFQRSDGWDVKIKPIGSSSLANLAESRVDDYQHAMRPLETKPMNEVLQCIFGYPPERKNYPELNEINLKSLEEGEGVSAEEYADMVEKKEQIQKVGLVLEKLCAKAGCIVEGN